MCAAKQCQASYQAISVTRVTLGYYGWDRRCWSSLLSPKDIFPRFSYFIRKVKQRARKEAAEMFLESPFPQTADSRLDRNGSNRKLFHDVHELYLWVTGTECHLGKMCGDACLDHFQVAFLWGMGCMSVPLWPSPQRKDGNSLIPWDFAAIRWQIHWINMPIQTTSVDQGRSGSAWQ